MANTNTKEQGRVGDLDRLAAVVLAVRRLSPATIDEDAIRTLVGDVKLRTLREVAYVFTLSRNTIGQSWRGGGMPGDAGSYVVADILVWLLQREAKRADRSSVNPVNGPAAELREIELETARATLVIRRAKALRETSQYVPLAAARSVLAGTLNALRGALLDIPRRLSPMFPVRQADSLTAEVEGCIRNALVAASETPIDDILERINNSNEGDK